MLTAEPWIHELPHARMEYPSGVIDRLKYWFWRAYTPLHPYVRDTTLALRLMEHEGRDHYLLGSLHPEKELKDFVDHLINQGFGNHFVAWKETGEVIGLRKTHGFRYQYHVRVFKDGEVRCHFEYTPEYRPLQHLLNIGCEDRSHEFKTFLGEWVVS